MFIFKTWSRRRRRRLARRQMSNGGTLLSFTLAGGQDAAFTVLNALRLADISNNLGDSKSLACHPYTTTHSNMSPEDRSSLGISAGHIRLSVGLVDADDLIEDLDQALAFLVASAAKNWNCKLGSRQKAKLSSRDQSKAKLSSHRQVGC